MKKILFLCFAIVVCATSVWAASASRTINYQGRVTDLSGNPVVDGTHSIVVSFYDAPTGGTLKWTDSFTSVNTKNGYFNILLGSGTQKLDTLDFSVQYYIGVRVDMDSEMTPRQPLAGVPYALNVETPVGAIVAWHKNLFAAAAIPTTPTLPGNFVECNGQTLNDPDSILNGAVIPNLNGQGRFLRGSATSGTLQDDAFQGHRMNRNTLGNTEYVPTIGGSGYDLVAGTRVLFSGNTTGDPITDGTNGTPRTASETRPTNMSVVWIMRIK